MGLARWESAGGDDRSLTGTHLGMGTLDFMAPEQAESARRAGPAADDRFLTTLMLDQNASDIEAGETTESQGNSETPVANGSNREIDQTPGDSLITLGWRDLMPGERQPSMPQTGDATGRPRVVDILGELRLIDDPGPMTRLVHTYRERGGGLELLWDAAQQADERRLRANGEEKRIRDRVLYGVLLALGEFSYSEIPDSIRRPLLSRLARPFAIFDREITRAKFEASGIDSVHITNFAPVPEQAMVGVSWYDSVRFCRWWTKQAGMSESEQFYFDPDRIDAKVYPPDPVPGASGEPNDEPDP